MRAHMTMWDIAKRGEPARSFVSMARRPGECNPSWVAHGFAEALTRAFLYLLPGRTRALERGAAPIGAQHLAGGDPCD